MLGSICQTGMQSPALPGPSMERAADMGLKILLVDDEQEFVETLSERLQMRDMDTHAVLDRKSVV